MTTYIGVLEMKCDTWECKLQWITVWAFLQPLKYLSDKTN